MSTSEPRPVSELVAVSVADFLWFVDTALNLMALILRGLGNELANRRPELEGANSPFAILTHCLGVMEYWAGATVAGREVERDREAEFTAEGDVEGLLLRTAAARRQLEADISGIDAMSVPLIVYHDYESFVPYAQSKGAVLLHIMEELFQHLGQMELSRDALCTDG